MGVLGFLETLFGVGESSGTHLRFSCGFYLFFAFFLFCVCVCVCAGMDATFGGATRSLCSNETENNSIEIDDGIE